MKVFCLPLGYKNTDASQSSSNSGSSSFSDLSLGRRVERSARCVVRESNGNGYDKGAESSRIYKCVNAALRNQIYGVDSRQDTTSNEIAY